MDHPGLFYLEQDLRRSLRKAWYQTARYLEQHPEEDAGQVWARVLERNVHAFAYQLPMNLYDWGITEGYSELSHAAEVSLRVSKTSSEDPIRKGKNYQMKKGDTLIGIARRYGITLEQLYEVNPGLKEQDPRKLAVGTVLTLPYGAPFRMKAQIEVFVPLHQDRILEAYYNLGLLRRLTGVKALDLQYYRDPRSPSPLAPRSSFGNHPPTDAPPPNSWDKWNRRDTPSHAPWERNSHHGKGPGPWIEGYEQGGNRLDDNPAYPHYLMSAYDLRRKDTVQVQPYRKPPLKLSPHVNEPNQAFQLAPLIPALEEVSGKVIGRSLLAGAGWILTLLCLSGDTRREPLEMLPRGEDWPGPISSSVYDQLSAEEAQRYNELRYKKAAGKASDQESRDFQELEEKLVEGDGSTDVFDPLIKQGTTKGEILGVLEAINHVKYRDFSVPRRRGIGGAHDATEFIKYSDEYSILSRKTSSIPGVEKIEYKIYALDAKGKPTGTLKSTVYEKTVYDPEIWTDTKLEKALNEVLSESISRNKGTLPTDSPTYGVTIEGYQIIFTHREGKITSFWFN